MESYKTSQLDTQGRVGICAYIGNIGLFHLKKRKEDASERCSSPRATIEEQEELLTVAGVGHVRVVAVDACASTSHELIGVCMGGRHREMMGFGETVDVLGRVGKGNCDGSRCGSQESTKDSG